MLVLSPFGYGAEGLHRVPCAEVRGQVAPRRARGGDPPHCFDKEAIVAPRHPRSLALLHTTARFASSGRRATSSGPSSPVHPRKFQKRECAEVCHL